MTQFWKVNLIKRISSNEIWPIIKRSRYELFCYVLLCIIRNPLFALTRRAIFMEIFLLESKLVQVHVLYRPFDKYNFVNYLERTFSDTNVNINSI